MTQQSELRDQLIELDGELWDYQLDKLEQFITNYTNKQVEQAKHNCNAIPDEEPNTIHMNYFNTGYEKGKSDAQEETNKQIEAVLDRLESQRKRRKVISPRMISIYEKEFVELEAIEAERNRLQQDNIQYTTHPTGLGEYSLEELETEVLKAKLSVASNAKLFTNKHGATYIVFETEDRDVSQNELTAIFYNQLNQLNKIDTTLTTNKSKE